MVLSLLASCGSVVGDRTTVQNVGADQLLKLRSGPSLGYNIILGLPDGTALNRHECVTEVGQRWCRVSLGNAPQVSGYVSADYLTE
uniref:SH3 domain-containing protein n=1 Tax=Loktanella sp. S4079 TaxID=579483 RepID=UPI001EF7304C|nr:SH3 domain-containing protein [Loktanella sp. S4079]